MSMRSLLVAASVVCCVAPMAFAYDSSSYVQNGLIAQWDGIDNAGTGTHDPTATTWKDLAGSNDLTLTNTAAWCRGIGLSMEQQPTGSAGAYGATVAPTYKTIEILFKETSRTSRILLWSGNNSRYVIFDYGNVTTPFVWAYFDGRSEVVKARPTPYVKVQAYAPTALVATYGTNNEVADVFCDGVQRHCGGSVNNWGNGDNCLTLGSRTLATSGYGWSGEIYAIRFYDRVLTPDEIARNHAIDVKRFYTSAIYDKAGMTSFWDAKDNVGEGQHDSATNIWKNLIAGGQDLTLQNSTWKSEALQCYNVNASGAYGTTPQTFTSMEVVFRNELNNGNSWLFSGGAPNYYCVLGTLRAQWCNNEGLYDTFSYARCGLHSLATTRGASTTNAYVDGVSAYYDKRQDPARANDLDGWGYGGAFVQVGGRSDGSVDFLGRIHSVRLYDNVPNSDQMRSNGEIDRVRYANPLTWHGSSGAVGDGDFETSGNWVDVDQTTRIPGTENTVNLPYGTYKIRTSGNQTVAAMAARNGNVEKLGQYIDATLDMGGKTFTVIGDYRADSVRGVDGHRNASLTLTNGTFKVGESVQVGALAERITTNPYTDYITAFPRGSGSLIMEGANTAVDVAWTLTMEGPFTRLRVANSTSYATGNMLNVLDGSVFGYGEGGASARLEIGICGNTSFSGVNVSNATVNCVRLIAGSKVATAASSNNLVHVMGETAKINVSGAGQDSIYLRMGTRLKFTIPENSFAETPLVTAGGLTVVDDEATYAVDPVKLVIDGSAFKGDCQTLIQCASDSTAAFQKLIDNKTKSGGGHLFIADGGTKLVWARTGTRLIVR